MQVPLRGPSPDPLVARFRHLHQELGGKSTSASSVVDGSMTRADGRENVLEIPDFLFEACFCLSFLV